MEQLLNALAAHRENRDYQDTYKTSARQESPEILDWCQDEQNYNVLMFNIHYTQFKHRRLGLILVLAYFQAAVQKNDAVGVPKSDVLYGMKCNTRTGQRIVKDGIEGGFIGQTINKTKKSQKVLYATEVMLHTYMNKTYRFFHDENMKSTLDYSYKIRDHIKTHFGQQVPNVHRMKIMENWVKNKGKKFINGRIPR